MLKHTTWIASSILLLSALVAVGAGCSRKPKPTVVPATITQQPAVSETTTPPVTPTGSTAGSTLELQDVFFDYDRFVLRDDARDALSADAKTLVENVGPSILLEGHCDERGTVEYNLALGERRANAVRSYLVQYGVDQSRLTTISYGEERPFVPGQDESAWSQNRRVHFVKK